MRNQGINVVDYLVRISLVNAEEEVYSALSVPKTKQIWKLEKIRGSEKAKYLYSISYFHPRVGIKGNENFSFPELPEPSRCVAEILDPEVDEKYTLSDKTV